jgi:hypothetical protein
MAQINLSMQHGQTLEAAQHRLTTAVHEIHRRCSACIQQVTWSADRCRVRLQGTGFWVDMSVDAQAVHVSGDIALLGGLLGGPLATGLTQIVQQVFQKQLPSTTPP